MAKTPAWQRKAGKNPKGGLNAKGRASYKKQTGGTLKAPVKSGDNIMGSVNLLHEESWYSDNDGKIAQSFVSVISEAL